MNDHEMRLFFGLCDSAAPTSEPLTRDRLIHFSPEVLGHLFANRMQAVAYRRLLEADALGDIPREFRTALEGAFRQNEEKNRVYFSCLQQLGDILTPYEGRYAMLKGAVLCRLYPAGCRTANDVDLLVRGDDVSAIGAVLSAAGFRQGHVRGGRFVAASRAAIIASKMMRGETVPYIRATGNVWMPFLEVDLNFSLDYQGDVHGATDALLERATHWTAGDLTVATLDRSDFFLQLCAHLYKEAATLPWVQMGRDMTLYKYHDVRLFWQSMTADERARFWKRAAELNMTEMCRCALQWTADLFDGGHTDADSPLLHTVVSPADGKRFQYEEKNLRARFFLPRRDANLKEVIR